MSGETLILLGAGGHGRCVADVATRCGHWKEVCFLDDRAGITPGGFDVRGSLSSFTQHRGEGVAFFVSLGDNAARRGWIDRLRASGIVCATIVAPSAVLSSRARLGAGSVLMPRAVVNVGAQLGEGTIINTAATVDHDCELGRCVHLSPGVHLGGDVNIGEDTWLGIGSTVRHAIRIGARSIVGAGSVVVQDLAAEVLAFGVPARVQSSRVQAS